MDEKEAKVMEELLLLAAELPEEERNQWYTVGVCMVEDYILYNGTSFRLID